ncbi:MAG: TIGR00730 family Rossman fold protein [Patescibacteria group bacterium]|nr:TIGR00730 family Rossman fold protein [bacterium]MDZ4240693.1 TIGR00730 family Rossman fold protein [Patescibacteria group bacterium]
MEHNEQNRQKPAFKTITLDELEIDAKKRLSVIGSEFARGFEFLRNYPKSVTFFGSSRVKESDPYYKKAETLAKRIVEEMGYSVIAGGGPGIMEAANKGAYEAGGTSLGLNIKLPNEQVTNPYVTDSINFYYFFVRKVCLSFSAEAYVFFPGGFGTLDEMFEIVTLIQTKKIKHVPIILVGKEYWLELEKFIEKNLCASGMIHKEDMDLYHITDDEDEIIDMIRTTPVQSGVPYGDHHK